MFSLGVVNLTPPPPPPLQISAAEGPIGVKIDKDIETPFFSRQKHFILIDTIIYANYIILQIY